jgi:hypothetical protein
MIHLERMRQYVYIMNAINLGKQSAKPVAGFRIQEQVVMFIE